MDVADTRKAAVDKRIISAMNAVSDSDVKKTLSGSDKTLCSFKFFREHEKAFRKLLPKYVDVMLEEYTDTYSAYSYIDRSELLSYMCLELGIVDPCDIDSVKCFSSAGIKVSDFYSVAPISTVFKRGLDNGSFVCGDVLRFIEDNPDYLLYFLPLLTAIDSEEFSGAVTRYLQSAGLQDTLRYHLLCAMLKSRNAGALLKFTEIIEKYDFYRLKAFNEVAVSVGSYDIVLPPKELVSVLRDAACGDTAKYMNADFKHAWHFINAYDRINLKTEDVFSTFARDLLKNGGTRSKQAMLYSLDGDSINKRFIADIFMGELTLEDLSFFLHNVDVAIIEDKNLPSVFEQLYRLLANMDKVSYHYKTDDDISFARDVYKSNVVGVLAQISARLSEITYTQRLDALYDTFKDEAQARYLENNAQKTKLDVRAMAIRFLKTDNYTALRFYDKQKIKLVYAEAVIVSDYLKTKKQSVKTKIIKEFLRSEDSERIAEYLCGCAEEYKSSVGAEMRVSMGKVSADKLETPTQMFAWNTESVFEVKYPESEIKKLACRNIVRPKIKPMSYDRFKKFWDELNAFRENNRDFEYDTSYGDGKVTLGTKFTMLKRDAQSAHPTFDSYPLGAGFKRIYADLRPNELCFVTILVHCLLADNAKLFGSIFDGREAKKIYEFLRRFDKSYFADNEFRIMRELHVPTIHELLDADMLCDIIYAYTEKKPIACMRKDGNGFYYACDIPDDCEKVLIERCGDGIEIPLLLQTDSRFIIGGLINGTSLELTSKAYERGYISAELARYYIYKRGYIGSLFDGDHDGNIMRSAYPNKKFRDLVLEFVDEAVENEFKRGSLQTLYSGMICHCRKLFGVKYYVKAVAALRGLTWVRSPFGCDKDDVFSAIVKLSVKAQNDTYGMFVALVEEYGLTKDELIKATLFNPEFADYTAEYLQIPGLKSAVFWFVAHLNETLYNEAKDKREQQIKEFSDISYPDFQDGAFDYAWYCDMVNTVPKVELKRIYDNAKYVTVGGLHKRAQRFFDAVGGRIDKRECLEKIYGTRNKDYCLIYSLVPISGKTDLYERYEVLSEFVRSSKQFGAQRQASERRTVDIAFENLARAAGYDDPDVFVFEMESQQPSDIYKPHAIGDLTVTPYIDEKAFKISYTVDRDGKRLASVPSKYGKDKTLCALRDRIKTLNKKFSRIKTSFEKCMVNGVAFTAEQIRSMCREKLISAVLDKLLLDADGTLCVCRDGDLFDMSGSKLADPRAVVVAHPARWSSRIPRGLSLRARSCPRSNMWLRTISNNRSSKRCEKYILSRNKKIRKPKCCGLKATA